MFKNYAAGRKMHMVKSISVFITSLSALVIACAVALFFAQPAVAQSAKKLKCTGCVKSKQIKNRSIKSEDIRDGQVRNPDLGNNAVTSGKIANKAVTLDKLGEDVTALGLEGVAVIGPGDFHGRDGNALDDWVINSFGYVQGTNASGTGCVAAPVHLPDGVTITEMELVFFDNSAAHMTVQLRRTSLLDGVSSAVAVVSTSGIQAPALIRWSDTTIDQPVVDAVDSTYLLVTGACLADVNLRIYGVRIFYD